MFNRIIPNIVYISNFNYHLLAVKTKAKTFLIQTKYIFERILKLIQNTQSLINNNNVMLRKSVLFQDMVKDKKSYGLDISLSTDQFLVTSKLQAQNNLELIKISKPQTSERDKATIYYFFYAHHVRFNAAYFLPCKQFVYFNMAIRIRPAKNLREGNAHQL